MTPLSLSGPHLATVTSVHDGDTIRCDIEVGTLLLADESLTVVTKGRPVRLAGCNAWELSTDAGKAARDNLTARLPVGTPVVLTAVTGYKYGNSGEVVAGITVAGVDLIAELIAQQWAAPYDGTGKMTDHVPPWPRTVV